MRRTRYYKTAWISGLLSLSALGFTTGLIGAEEADPSEPIENFALGSHRPVNLAHTDSVEFQPIQLDELTNPVTGQPVQEFDIIYLENGGDLQLVSAIEILDLLNKIERRMNEIGVSLRDADPQVVINAIRNPDQWGREVRNRLDMELDRLADEYIPGRGRCDQINPDKFSDLGINPETGIPYKAEDLVSLVGDFSIPVRDLVPKLNEQQKLLCELGVSLLDEVLPGDANFLSSILEKRDELMNRFGFDTTHPVFNMSSWASKINPEQVKEAIKDIEQAIEDPSPERLYALAKKYEANLPPSLRIPDIPNIPAPTVDRRTDLKLKKRYDWKGINEGSKDKAAVYAYAWAELRAGRQQDGDNEPYDEQAFQAEANGGIYLVDNQINVLGANIDSELNSNNAWATWKACFLTTCASPEKPYGIKDFKIEEGDPSVFHKEWVEDYAQQFMVGPVPVVLRFGGSFHTNVGWNIGLTLLSADGQAVATVKAKAKGEAAIGVQDFVEAGAGGEISIINNTTTLAGNARLQFQGDGRPFITANIVGDNDITYLDGRIYGYAMVDVLGPLGDLAEGIVDSIKELGAGADGLIKQLGAGSEFAKKLAGQLGKSVEDFFKSPGRSIKKLGKKLGFSHAPILSGNPYGGLSINGTRVRYEHDWATWTGIRKPHRFLNYKTYIGPDGEEYSGDVASFSPERAQLLEENIRLEERVAEVARLEADIARSERQVAEIVSEFLGTEQSSLVRPLATAITDKVSGLKERKDNILATVVD